MQHPAQCVVKSRSLDVPETLCIGNFQEEEDGFFDWTFTVHLQYSNHMFG